VLVPQVAFADTVGVSQYRQRLDSVRRTLVSARGSTGSVRVSLLGDAQAALRGTSAVTLPSGETLAIDDRSLVAGVEATDGSLDAAIARVNTRIALVSRIGAPEVDPARADARLREVGV